MGELAKPVGQDLVTGRQRIGDGNFPAGGTGCRENEALPLFGSEDLLQIFEERGNEFWKIGRTMILRRNMHGAEDGIRDIGGAWNVEMIATWHQGYLN